MMGVFDFFGFNELHRPAQTLFSANLPIKHVEEFPSPPPKAVWYPDAVAYRPNEMKTIGKRPNGYFEGITIHWTAGRVERQDQGFQQINLAIRGYKLKNRIGRFYKYYGNFDVIGRDGRYLQSTPYDMAGLHAGKSRSHEFGSRNSLYTLGIEMVSAGRLVRQGDKFYSWYGGLVPANEVVEVKQYGEMPAGFVHRFTDAQMQSLFDFIVWAYQNNPEVFQGWSTIVGHHEISPGRKLDPYGALHMPGDDKIMVMYEVREYIESLT